LPLAPRAKLGWGHHETTAKGIAMLTPNRIDPELVSQDYGLLQRV